jgi:cation diffusion facilitator CzcD-associated flavoprotein CzcO
MRVPASPTRNAALNAATTPADCDVAIVGAGPYGLAAAAHLARTDGLDVRIFGRPMSFWDEQMPRGMLLRSPYVATTIGSPDDAHSLDAYQRMTGRLVTRPVPLSDFVAYGRWFAQGLSTTSDERFVETIETSPAGFVLRLADGDATTARRVVIAGGIAPFADRPTVFGAVDAEHATHASEHRDLGVFAGKRVLVVGGGQSALESAALLTEGGARVEMVVREDRIFFLRRAPIIHKLGPITKAAFAPAEVGPAGISRLVSAPRVFRSLPRRTQDRFSVRSLRPAGAAWLTDRVRDVPINLGRTVTAVQVRNGRLEVTLDDTSRREADHVLLATGYRVDIAKYPFLPAAILGRVRQVDGYPVLSSGFESTLAGLYVIGAPSAWSYGPLMRFVAGSEFAAPTLARAIRAAGARTRAR